MKNFHKFFQSSFLFSYIHLSSLLTVYICWSAL
nr:MAG TPA: hypothetical protein [Caudoviricetes sp.]